MSTQMERETDQSKNSSVVPNNCATEPTDESWKRPVVADRLKRDEWSEGAVSSLLEAYEAKWVLRNRAKLKGHDWDDVARHVSARSDHTKSPKTMTQCKNKIESMKKRYRAESAAADACSSWPLYPRLDHLLRGSVARSQPPQAALPVSSVGPLVLLEPATVAVQPPPPPAPPLVTLGTEQNSHGSNGVDREAKQEDGVGPKLSEHSSDKLMEMDTDSSTPALYSHKEKLKPKKQKTKPKQKRKNEGCEIAGSIRWLAEVMMRSERARMETMRDIEKMRAEVEAKRGEMDLKRTEIIANTQLEIARLFAGALSNKGVDSSLHMGRN